MSEETKNDEWVYQRLAALPVSSNRTNIDAALAHYRSYERYSRRRNTIQRAAFLSLAIVAVLMVALPSNRAAARELLDRFYMRRPAAVRADAVAIGATSAFHIEHAAPRPSQFVFDIGRAREQAGFEPQFPALLNEQLVSGLAVLKLSGPVDVRLKIHVDDLITGLERRGLTDIHVPRTWEGSEISYHVGIGVGVVFLNGTLWQSPPPSIVVTPAGFPTVEFTEMALRIAGLGALEAHNARNIFVDTGGAFAIVPADAKSTFRNIELKSGPGLLFENSTSEDERQKCSLCAGPHERVLTWAASDRIFQLRSPTMTSNEMVTLASNLN
jgi:hypothetical protein